MDLATLKKEYLKYEKGFKIPNFKEINEVFEIEKIDAESDCFLRLIRKTMMDKIVNSLSFLDMLLNPMQAPRLYHSFIKNITQSDTELIDKIYEAFGTLSLECMPLEIDYSEKNESEMIIKIFSVWNESKSNFKQLLIKVGNPSKINNKKEKSYFG